MATDKSVAVRGTKSKPKAVYSLAAITSKSQLYAINVRCAPLVRKDPSEEMLGVAESNHQSSGGTRCLDCKFGCEARVR